MKKVLLFNPRAGNPVHVIPNAILAIAASVEGIVEYVIVDGNRERDPLTKILNYLNTGEFDFFASTVMPGPQLKQAIPFTKLIREKFPQLKIIWGGYFASNHHNTVIKSGYVDVVISGPGDKAFPAVLEAMNNNRPLDEIENLVFIRDGKIVKTKKATLYEQDELRPLPYDKLNTFYPMKEFLGKTF